MNTIPGSGRPSRNSQGICIVSQHSTGYTTPQLDEQGTPVNTPVPRSILTKNGPDQDSSSSGTSPSQQQVESFTPCVRQNNRFVDLSGKPLQPGTVIICDKIPFVVPNSPSTFSSIINSVIGLFPRFSSKQTDSDKHKNGHQVQSIIEALKHYVVMVTKV